MKIRDVIIDLTDTIFYYTNFAHERQNIYYLI
jgi:hypothetical protein